MATTPRTNPYRTIAVAIDDEDEVRVDSPGEGAKKIATTPLMIESVDERRDEQVWQVVVEREGERRWASTSRFKLIVVSIFAMSLVVVGGKKYHNEIYSLSSGASDPGNSNNQEIIFDEDYGGNDFFVPLTADEREEMKEFLRSTLRKTKHALLNSAGASGNRGTLQQSPQRTLVLDSDLPKQFMHMHHMKTGGTSMDGLIRCSINRQRNLLDGSSISYSSMSECGPRVKSCMEDLARQLNASVVDNVFYHNDPTGLPQVDLHSSFDPADEALDIPIDDLNVCTTSESNVMSYCASLHTVRTFGWKDVDKITIIRNPVDRAWSMYRFKLNSCYKCEELKDVLRKIENGTYTYGKTGEEKIIPNFVYGASDSCAVQMIGHQATNLLSSIDLYNVANDVRFPKEREIAMEAVRNLRKEFTWIGITDRIQESIDGIRTVFPFLAENLTETVASLQAMFQKDDEQFGLPESYVDVSGCAFEHRNSGRDPTCGTTELDNETIALIEKLNNRDVAVYKAAVERFKLQMEVLDEYRGGFIS